MAAENQADDACLDSLFLQGLEVLQSAGLLWEFCCLGLNVKGSELFSCFFVGTC